MQTVLPRIKGQESSVFSSFKKFLKIQDQNKNFKHVAVVDLTKAFAMVPLSGLSNLATRSL